MSSYKITGADAIRLAERDSLQCYCYATPIDNAGPVTIELAKDILRDDPSLVYVRVAIHGWVDRDGHRLSELPGYNVADYFNAAGMYLGPDHEGVEPRWTEAAWKTVSGGDETTLATLLCNLPDHCVDHCDGELYEAVKAAGYNIGVRQLIDQWNCWGVTVGDFRLRLRKAR